MSHHYGGPRIQSVAGRTQTVDRRAMAMREAMKVHDQCRVFLAQMGRECPANLKEAIDEVFCEGGLTPDECDHWHAIRVAANQARHEWPQQ